MVGVSTLNETSHLGRMSSVVVRAAIDGQRLIADIVLEYPVWKDLNNGQVTVTGVGIYDESEDFIAPVDFNARYDDDE